MSVESVEIVHRVVAAWNRRDSDAILTFADPDIEYVNPPSAVEPGTRRGHDEVAKVFQTQWEGLADAVQVIDRIHDRGEEIITEGRVSRGMPGSDARVDNRALIAWTIREGTIIRMQVLGAGSEFDDAREAAGLRDQGGE